MRHKLILVVAAVLLFVTGVFGGRGAGTVVHWMTSPAPIALGDRSELLQRVDARLVLFSLSTCPYCRQARAWLNDHHVSFKELVVDTSPQAQRLFGELREPALPVLVTRDRLVRGFEPGAYAQATIDYVEAQTAMTPATHPTVLAASARARANDTP